MGARLIPVPGGTTADRDATAEARASRAFCADITASPPRAALMSTPTPDVGTVAMQPWSWVAALSVVMVRARCECRDPAACSRRHAPSLVAAAAARAQCIFLAASMGANDVANAFGAAVGSKVAAPSRAAARANWRLSAASAGCDAATSDDCGGADERGGRALARQHGAWARASGGGGDGERGADCAGARRCRRRSRAAW